MKSKIDLMNILTRALKTFVQAFVPVLIAAFQLEDITDISNIKAVGYSAMISATAAGISAVWNGVLEAISQK